ncbi:MAG TPA: cyclic nucleotide-binding domain-containing protein [Candidatus Deferrimicrobiaceae bacterium]|nr:cyclic nucleotide-binding domain-containing protein [Candidatus Deferrimicrobiaceae bacterium]
MEAGELGRVLEPGETLFSQGDPGDCMFVIQEGRVEIVIDQGGRPIKIADRAAGECVGEMALFEREVRMATVRAMERTRVLTVDRKNLLQRIHEDPSLGYRLIQTLSQRLRQLTHEVVRLKRTGQAAD